MAVGRKYRLILFLCLAAFGSKLLSQNDTLNFTKVDSVSYSLYTEKKWDELIKYCRYAVSGGYDYYYLRVRAGIACFEKKQYRAAAVQLEKALAFNAGDALANEYLYYSYIYSGRNEQARWLSRSFDPEFAAGIKTLKLSPVAFVMAEGGVKVSDSTGRFKTAVYSQVGIGHYVSRRFSLFHAFTYYKQDEQRFNVQQFQYFLNAALPLKHGFLLSGGFHTVYDHVDVRNYKLVESVSIGTATMYPPPGVPLPPPGQSLPTYTYAVHSASLQSYYENRKILNCIGAVTLLKHTPLFDLSVGATASFMDTVKQYQANGGVTCYPLKNNRLAISANVYAHTADAVKNISIAFAPSVSVLLTRKLWASVAYFNNQGLNIVEQNGYLVNNSPDYTTGRYSGSLSYAVFKKFYIYGTYVFENKKEITGTFKYNYNIFILGIRMVPS